MNHIWHQFLNNLLSLSTMITVVDSVVFTISGSDASSIVNSNSSSNSTILSVVTETLNSTLVAPAGIVTLYGPGS